MKNLTIVLLIVVSLFIFMSGCSRKDQDFQREKPLTAFPAPENLQLLDLRLQKIIKAVQSKPTITADFCTSIDGKGDLAWNNSLISLRGNTVVALIPLKQEEENSFERFMAVELDSALRFRIFDANSFSTYASNAKAGDPTLFEINHALNALNNIGFGRKVYLTKGLPQAELKKLEQYKGSRKMAPIQQKKLAAVITITNCYSWSACTGDGNGNCVGEIYYFTECVSETIWFKSDDVGYDMGGGYETGGGGADPNIPSSPEDLQKVQVFPPQVPINDPKKYLSCFDTSQPAKVIIYADQPVPGTSEPFSILGGIGHAYMSFEQNVNGNTIRRTVGFYNGTKVDPFYNKSAPGTLGNDSTHEYNVKWETNLTSDQFDKMIQATISHAPEYNIESYNCANFVLDVTSAGGINLPRTKGWWYTGSGLNPGALGEDLRKQPGAVSGKGHTENNVGECQ
ncbi:hypothetical protein [Chitinophaga niabensis]|uniref:Uncharacterized protein n=1 Tax=Chitinophaga niabensis TaxID=536979 RepID=A0A1N6E5L3_9BACT|nr:hypothetical protein [Chitinophaga niabensis]SIN78286.1 hypothetical protein SAMN04488055_1319 [Chitinophaga niabensis]